MSRTRRSLDLGSSLRYHPHAVLLEDRLPAGLLFDGLFWHPWNLVPGSRTLEHDDAPGPHTAPAEWAAPVPAASAWVAPWKFGSEWLPLEDRPDGLQAQHGISVASSSIEPLELRNLPRRESDGPGPAATRVVPDSGPTVGVVAGSVLPQTANPTGWLRGMTPSDLDALLLVLAATQPAVLAGPTTAATPGSVRFAVIGDYGCSDLPGYCPGDAERDVANLVKGWNPDFVITTGDNNYPIGAEETLAQNIGQYYCDFIHNPDAPAPLRCHNDLTENRYFPSLGNHDWYSSVGGLPRPYLDYFTLPTGPGNERYYKVSRGPVDLFALDSEAFNPYGAIKEAPAVQGNWLQKELANSTARWKLVYMHHPPYSSGAHGSQDWIRWDFQGWGATAVLAGHDHLYERIVRNGFPYFVNGSGGNPDLYTFGTIEEGSQVRCNCDYGAMLVEAGDEALTFQFYTRAGMLLDSYQILTPAGSSWKYLDDGSDQGVAWRQPGFNDSAWASGRAQLGYGDGNERTVVSYGDDAANKYITTYFRQTVTVNDAGRYNNLLLRLLRDDGAVVYLNGAEVVRSNLPGGDLTYRTLASEPVGGDDETRFFDFPIPSRYLVNGPNVLAVEIHQSMPDSSDLSFDLQLDDASTGVTLAECGATWKYRDEGTNEGTAWRQPGFDDSGWHEGLAQLGYGDDDHRLRTTVGYGSDPLDKYITTYFRLAFPVDDPARYRGLTLRLLRDDGAVVYLNGTEIVRSNMPPGTIDYRTRAVQAVPQEEEEIFHAFPVDPRQLVSGSNVLAVEIHQVAPDSSDIRMDLDLVGLLLSPP